MRTLSARKWSWLPVIKVTTVSLHNVNIPLFWGLMLRFLWAWHRRERPVNVCQKIVVIMWSGSCQTDVDCCPRCDCNQHSWCTAASVSTVFSTADTYTPTPASDKYLQRGKSKMADANLVETYYGNYIMSDVNSSELPADLQVMRIRYCPCVC